MTDFFRKIKATAKDQGITGTEAEARNWFKKQVAKIGKKLSGNEVLKSEPKRLRNRPGIGNMYFYFYDPKWKKELPYYDKFPLTIVIDFYDDGFLGLNLHYLHPATRALVLHKLMDLATNRKMNDKTRLKISYRLLKGLAKYKEVKPTIKRYLYKHVKSRMLKLDADEWLPAVFLPVAQFEKASKTKVWADSKKMY